MNIKDCFFLGTVAKLHGFKGEVSLFLDVSNPGDYRHLNTVFIEIEGILVPFFIEHTKVKNKGFITVKFQGIDTESLAKALLKKSLYLPLNQLIELDDLSFYDHEVIGYSVTDVKKGDIGVVTNVLDIKSNPLLVISSDSHKEILIPIFKGLVKKVNRNSKALCIEAPEGLIELYL